MIADRKSSKKDVGFMGIRVYAETGFPCYPLFARDASQDPICHDRRFQAFLADMQKQSESLRNALFPDRR